MRNGNNDRLRRSNMVLIGLVVLMLLYGLFYRIQSGDSTLYVFGYKINLPFGTQQEVEEPQPEQEIEVEESEGNGK